MADDLRESLTESVRISVLMLGAPNVGKSSLVRSFIGENFLFTLVRTVGVDVKSRSVNFDDSERLARLNLFDAAGHNTFESIVNSYYRKADGYVLVFDVTSRESFDELELWMQKLTNVGGSEEKGFFLICNKIDLDRDSQVTDDEIQEFCQKYPELSVREPNFASAKTGEGVEEIFVEICKILLHDRKGETHRRSTIDIDAPNSRRDTTCTKNYDDKDDNGDKCGCSIL